MNIFLQILEWILFVVCMVAPVSIALTFSIGGKVATILSGVWGLPCGFIAAKLILKGEQLWIYFYPMKKMSLKVCQY